MRYGGRDLSRKIRGEILRRTPPRMPQDLLWRPIWCQICPKLAGTGFRSQLVHFCPGPGPGYFLYIIIKYFLCIIIRYSFCIIFQYSICIIIRYSLCIIIRYSLCRIIRYSLCGTDTVSVWDTHSVSVWDTHSPGWRAGGSRTTPTPHWGFPVPTHTPTIAIPQLRGEY